MNAAGQVAEFTSNGRSRSDMRRRIAIGVLGTGLTIVAVAAPGDASFSSRVVIATFGWAVVLWLLAKIKDLYVAIGAATVVFVAVGLPFATLLHVATNGTTITIVAAFVIAAAVRRVRLTEYLIGRITSKPHSASNAINRVAGATAASVLIIPATSARAALTLPVVESMATGASAQFSKAIKIVVPVVVLTSAGASLLGAGAHIIAVEFLQQSAGASVNFVQWIAWCAPYALVATLLSVILIKSRYLPKSERSRLLEPASPVVSEVLTRKQIGVSVVLVLVIAGWIGASLTGIDIAIPTVIATVALMIPPIAAITPAQAVRAVPWELVAFLCASLVLAEIFVASGSACYVVGPLIGGCQAFAQTPWLVVVLVIVISMFAHLIIHSRSARSAVLVPLVLPLATVTGLNPVSLVLASTLAAGYCLTLPVCAKPLLMYCQDDAFDRGDLLRLSAWLLPMNAILLSLTAIFLWPLMGLPIK